jgi:hypothetical protein
VPLWTETACRFPPKPPAGLNRNRLSETPKFAIRSAVRPVFAKTALDNDRFGLQRKGLTTPEVADPSPGHRMADTP